MRSQSPPDEVAELSHELADALGTLIKRASAIGHELAGELGILPSDLLGLFKLDDGNSMKELAKRMGCDASFVTAVADNLESHGLVRREPSARDRRVKNLVLTKEGVATKEQLMRELAIRMPWCEALDVSERRLFLSLLRKMADGATGPARCPLGGEAVTKAVPVPSL